MSLFQFLQLQEVEPEDASSSLDYFTSSNITLEDTIDAEALDKWWTDVLHGGDGE